jgi:Fic family protein
MKMPKSPPSWFDNFPSFIEKHGAASLSKDLELLPYSEDYLHWDRLRYKHSPKSWKNAPKDWSHEDWWTVLKSNRVSRYQKISLSDSNGQPFVFFLTQAMFANVHHLDKQCGGAMGGLSEGKTLSEDSSRYYISSLIEESITSSQLEGAAVTREIAKEMLRSNKKPSSTNERMILNNFITMREIRNHIDEDLTPELILQFHRTLTTGTLKNEEASGRLRTSQEQIEVIDTTTEEVMHTPPPADQLEDRLKKLCEFANKKEMDGYMHPIIRSIVLHFSLAYDHPFVDGNGRTARALFYWSMLKHGYWMMEYVSLSSILLKAPVQYYKAFLYTETDGGDLNYFIIHQLDSLSKAIDALHKYREKKQQEQRGDAELLEGLAKWNYRQKALLSHALRHPNAEYTVNSHQNSHGINNQTSRNDLNALVKASLLESSKIGRKSYFRPVKDFRLKL